MFDFSDLLQDLVLQHLSRHPQDQNGLLLAHRQLLDNGQDLVGAGKDLGHVLVGPDAVEPGVELPRLLRPHGSVTHSTDIEKKARGEFKRKYNSSLILFLSDEKSLSSCFNK